MMEETPTLLVNSTINSCLKTMRLILSLRLDRIWPTSFKNRGIYFQMLWLTDSRSVNRETRPLLNGSSPQRRAYVTVICFFDSGFRCQACPSHAYRMGRLSAGLTTTTK